MGFGRAHSNSQNGESRGRETHLERMKDRGNSNDTDPSLFAPPLQSSVPTPSLSTGCGAIITSCVALAVTLFNAALPAFKEFYQLEEAREIRVPPLPLDYQLPSQFFFVISPVSRYLTRLFNWLISCLRHLAIGPHCREKVPALGDDHPKLLDSPSRVPNNHLRSALSNLLRRPVYLAYRE